MTRRGQRFARTAIAPAAIIVVSTTATGRIEDPDPPVPDTPPPGFFDAYGRTRAVFDGPTHFDISVSITPVGWGPRRSSMALMMNFLSRS